jgi:hypothetical protein
MTRHRNKRVNPVDSDIVTTRVRPCDSGVVTALVMFGLEA